jgi:hypothetical protein
VYDRINKLRNDRNILEKNANAPLGETPKLLPMVATALQKGQEGMPKTIGNTPSLANRRLRHGGRVLGADGVYEKIAGHAPAPSSLREGFKNLFYEYAPKVTAASAVAGIGYAYKKLHDVWEKRKEKKEMEQNFNAVLQKDPALAANPNSRSYFDTISNFSPSLAKDSNTLSVLLNNFNTFDGIDLNTVKIMRDIEKNDREEFKLKIPGLEMQSKIT